MNTYSFTVYIFENLVGTNQNESNGLCYILTVLITPNSIFFVILHLVDLFIPFLRYESVRIGLIKLSFSFIQHTEA